MTKLKEIIMDVILGFICYLFLEGYLGEVLKLIPPEVKIENNVIIIIITLFLTSTIAEFISFGGISFKK